MKKLITCNLSFFLVCLMLTACNTATPEQYFDRAVLNTNMLVGFAGDGMQRELASPSVKMGKTKDEFAPMKRNEVVDSKIQYLEDAYKKVKDLKQTDETKDMVQASLQLYEYILPVYKNDYMQLAKLYDDAAPKETIELKEEDIYTKHHSRFEKLYSKLMALGKTYATKHDIKVNWAK